MKKVITCIICIIILCSQPLIVFAQNPLRLDASAAILFEMNSNTVLFGYNEHQRMYPASMTKILTALVAVEHLDLDHIIQIGPEIRNMPPGFGTNIHFEGETITVRNLLKTLMIRSVNESGRVLALNVVREVQGRWNIPYEEAKSTFSRMMNDMARSLGARDSNFNNPYGLHSENHFTTAYDMARIAQAYMQNDVLAEIAAIRQWQGDSLGGMSHPEANVREYNLVNTNLLLPGAEFGHPYVVGLKTGWTTPAGHCFAGTAFHNGLGLISVVFDAGNPGRWQDTRRLMDYGFFNYQFREVAMPEEQLKTVAVYNPRLGDEETIAIYSTEGFQTLMSHSDFARVQRHIEFLPETYVNGETGIALILPLEAGQSVGTVRYMVGNQILFSAPIVASRTVYERTFDSDMDYYISLILSSIFTLRAAPFWVGIFGIVFGIIGISLAVSISRRARSLQRYQAPSSAVVPRTRYKK